MEHRASDMDMDDNTTDYSVKAKGVGADDLNLSNLNINCAVVYPLNTGHLYSDSTCRNAFKGADYNNLSFAFPPIHYYQLADDQMLDKIARSSNLIMGGSWSIYCNLPMYDVRCAMLENLLMPYDLNSKHFKTRHGVLLWPRINTFAFTDLDRPQHVYFKKHNRVVAKMKFCTEHVELYEC